MVDHFFAKKADKTFSYLETRIPADYMAGFLYLGAGSGMALIQVCSTQKKKRSAFDPEGISMGGGNDPAP